MLLRPLRGLLFLLLIASFAAAIGVPIARADGLFVTPPSGMPGTTFLVQGGGFHGNEQVQLWSQFPDNRIVQLADTKADGGGNATFQVSTDSTFAFGSYVLAAHGTSSGNTVFGRLVIGSAGSSSVSVGTAYCQGQNFTVPGFASGERVAFSVQLPNGAVQTLGTVGADGGGNATFQLPLRPGLPIGAYVITGQGLSSGHQTSDTLTFDGSTLSGSHCSVSLGGSLPIGLVPGAIPKNIVQYRGPGVYLNTDPNNLYYFGCDFKWRQMDGIIYFLVLGFRPNEQVVISYEILGIQSRLNYATVNADGYGKVPFGINALSMAPGHYHWWFTSSSASYCGHYDHP